MKSASFPFIPIGFAAAMLLGASPSSYGTTFYIDYSAGDDSRNGTSATQSWKHCPGDIKAAGLAQARKLVPGDTVIFKGGIEYPGELDLKWSGEHGNSITLDGNSTGGFGTGRAIFSGAQRLTGWKRCASQQDAGSAAAWRSCFALELPQPLEPLALNLFYDGKRGVVAREPDIDNPMWWQDLQGFADIANADFTPTSLLLPAKLTAPPGENWSGAYVGAWSLTNHIELQPVTATAPDGRGLSFATINWRKTGNRFALFNHPRLLSRPGEYTVTDNGKRILFHAGDAQTIPEVTISVRRYGINLNGQSHYVIRNLTFQNFAGNEEERRAGGGVISWQSGAAKPSNLVIQNCESISNQSLAKVAGFHLVEVDHLRLENNRIAGNQGSAGILLSNCSNALVKGNELVENGGTGIRIFGSHDVLIENNRITGHMGMHANGISVYLASKNVRIERNTVTQGHIPLTIQSSQDITVDYNVFTTAVPNASAVAIWPPSKGLGPAINVALRNNVLQSADDNGLINNDPKATGLRIQNNIISGSTVAAGENAELSHNLYTARSWKQQKPGWQWETGAVQAEKNQTIFADAAKGDYRLAPASPALNAGINWGQKTDFAGNPIQGATPDIGAYEQQ